MPFARTCGIELTEAGPELVTGSVAWAPERCTAGDVIHGGVIMTLADSLGAACAFLNLPEGARTSTIESKTNFFRGIRCGRRPRHDPPAARRPEHHRRPDRRHRRRGATRGPGHPDPGRAALSVSEPERATLVGAGRDERRMSR